MGKYHIELFKELGEYDKNTLSTRWVCVDEFVDKFSALKLGNGGSWCRLDGKFGKYYKSIIVKANKTMRFSWDCSEDYKNDIYKEINKYFKDKTYNRGSSILLLKICGIKGDNYNRNIRSDIRSVLSKEVCVVCGNSNVEIDHKNGLYNDRRVLDIKTQTIDDFQALCRHCNIQKRNSIIWSLKNNKRFPASKIPQLAIFGIDFIEGDDTFDINDINAMKGSYWYDPIKFMSAILSLHNR